MASIVEQALQNYKMSDNLSVVDTAITNYQNSTDNIGIVDQIFHQSGDPNTNVSVGLKNALDTALKNRARASTPEFIEAFPMIGPELGAGLITQSEAIKAKAGPMGFNEKMQKDWSNAFLSATGIELVANTDLIKTGLRLQKDVYTGKPEQVMMPRAGINDMPKYYTETYSKENDLKSLESYLLAIQIADLDNEIRGCTTRGKIAAGILESAPFAIDFALTYGATAGMKATAIKAAEKLSEKYAKKAITKFAIEKTVEGIGAVARAGVQTMISPAHAKQQMGALLSNVTIDKNGDIQILDKGIPIAKQMLEVYMDSTIENLSEVSGSTIMKGLGIVGGAAGKKLGGKAVIGGIVKTYQKVFPKSTERQAISAIFDKIGVQGLPEEWMEERFGGLLRDVFGLPGGGILPASVEDAIVELGVLGIPTGARAALGVVADMAVSRPSIPRQVEQLENAKLVVQNLLTVPEEQKNQMLVDIDNNIIKLQSNLPENQPEIIPPETPGGRVRTSLSAMDTISETKIAPDENLTPLERARKQRDMARADLKEAKYNEELTKLGTRALDDRAINVMVKRAKRENKPVSVVMFDVKGLKEANDVFGHNAGDLVIKLAAQAIRENTRLTTAQRTGDVSGIASRVGGDEFSVNLYGANLEQANMIRGKIEQRHAELLKEHNIDTVDTTEGPHYIGMVGGASVIEPFSNKTIEQSRAEADGIAFENKRASKRALGQDPDARWSMGLVTGKVQKVPVIPKTEQTTPAGTKPKTLNIKVTGQDMKIPNVDNPGPIEPASDVSVDPQDHKFKHPTPFGAAFTSDIYYAQVLGVKPLTHPLEIGKQTFDLDYRQIAQNIDATMLELHEAEGTSRKEIRLYKKQGLPTTAMRNLAELLDTYEEAPAGITAAQTKAFNFYRQLGRELWEWENKVREKLGMDIIPYRTNYYRHLADKMAESMNKGEREIPQSIIYQYMHEVPNRVYNPTALSRTLGSELEKQYSRDVPSVMKALAYTALREIHLAEPLKFYDAEIARIGDAIPADTREWVGKFIKHRIMEQQTEKDRQMNEWVKNSGLGKALRTALKVFGKDLSDRPFTRFTRKIGRATIAGAMWGRVKNIPRNLLQEMQDLGLYTTKSCLKAYLPAPEICENIIQNSLLYRGYTGIERVGADNITKLEKAGLMPYQMSAVFNIKHAQKAAFWDTYDLLTNPKYKDLGNADPRRTYTEPKYFLYDTELAKIKSEMEFGPQATQFSYIPMATPGIFRHNALIPFTRLQSWWMNYFTMFGREMGTRAFTGKAASGLNLPWSRRLGAARYVIYAGYVFHMLGWDEKILTGQLPTTLAPVAHFMLAMYKWVASKNKRDQKRAERDMLYTLPVVIPGGLASRDIYNVWTGKKPPESLIIDVPKKAPIRQGEWW